MSKFQYLVGENFVSFLSSNDGIVVGIEHFLKNAEMRLLDSKSYKVGQGVSNVEVEKLQSLKNTYPHLQLKISERRENKGYVHKNSEKNVIITRPTQLGSNKFQSYLLLDDDCAEMSDHVTGQHIQGTVIIEAARQMMLSISENYLLKSTPQKNAYIILDNIQTNFLHFLFPLEVEIIFDVGMKKSSIYRTRYEAWFRFYQNKKKAVEGKLHFSIYDKEWLSSQEAKIANDLLTESLQG